MSQKKYINASDSVVLAGSKEEMKLLLIKRKNLPFKGEWALPGGFIEEGESSEGASKRELFEETGLDLGNTEGIPLEVRSLKGRDPRGDVTSHPFLFYLKDTSPLKGGSDALEAEWVSLKEVESLAFDHGAILCEALGCFCGLLQSKSYQNIELPSFLGGPLNWEKMESVTFFGGSFNPWHDGHRTCLDLCPEKNIVVIPDTNPFKEREKKGCFWNALKEISLRLEETPYKVFPGFFGRERPNPTADWFLALPFEKKGLLLGDDTFFQIEKWVNAKKLIESINHLYIVPRERSIKEIEKEAKRLNGLYPHISIRVLPEHVHQSVSSTKLRKMR